MCGIAGIILKEKNSLNLCEKIALMSDALKHRGPDGEGFLLAGNQGAIPYFNLTQNKYQRQDLNYIPTELLPNSSSEAFLAFAHRRLSIIDLGETGHQPMCVYDKNIWITFNGEIYNYIELKKELQDLGHIFVSESDTEVILFAYKAWGFSCVEKFNGMWAFCIYDAEKKICFASRDRLGVKPFYYLNQPDYFAFASEQKAFVKSKLLSAKMNKKALHNYLINGLTENEPDNFFENVTELWPGTSLVFNISTKEINIRPYYHLSEQINLNNDRLSEKQLVEKISETLITAVRLRLRSDVEVGTCLSGGIDSSALAAIITAITGKPLFCFTAIFKNQIFNEENFADIVARRIHAKHYKIEPSFEGFLEELDQLVYSQDSPIWSTSTYAQHKVMALAQQKGIKVVLDGQGADELFAGYHHHFIAQWDNLFSAGKIFPALKQILSANKTFKNPFSFYIKEHFKHLYNFNKKNLSLVYPSNFIHQYKIINPFAYQNFVNKQLLDDIYNTRLKAFLKCEDRCSMWHGVESRTPFSDDIDLINLMFSFDGNKKIKDGVSKYLLREAVKNKLPEEIYSRYDKRGFETPMQLWMQKMRPTILNEIKAANFEFVINNNLDKTNPANFTHNNHLFKLLMLSRWQKVFTEK